MRQHRIDRCTRVFRPWRCKNKRRPSASGRLASAMSRAGSPLPSLVVARAEGARIWDVDGKRVHRLRRRHRLREPRPFAARGRRGRARAGRPVPAPVLHGRDVRAVHRGVQAACRALDLPRRAAEVDPGEQRRRGDRERRQDRAHRDRPACRDRVRQRLPRPHAADDDDDREGRALQEGLRPVRARGLPDTRAVRVPRRHRGRRDRRAEAAVQGRRRSRSPSRAPCSSRCRARAASSR